MFCEDMYFSATGDERVDFVLRQERFKTWDELSNVCLPLNTVNNLKVNLLLIFVVRQHDEILYEIPETMILEESQTERSLAANQQVPFPRLHDLVDNHVQKRDHTLTKVRRQKGEQVMNRDAADDNF